MSQLHRARRVPASSPPHKTSARNSPATKHFHRPSATTTASFSTVSPHTSSPGAYSPYEPSRRPQQQLQHYQYSPQTEIAANIERLSGTAAIGQVQPIVDAHDAIWADLDIMDDIERRADQVSQQRNFFGKEHVAALEDLQELQIKLAATLEASADVVDPMADPARLWEIDDTDLTLEMISKVFNAKHFDGVQQGVDAVMEKLDLVVDSMNVLESQSRDLWNETDSHHP
ncbi:uncharacterized protein V2V93DRAFT_375790 [Kockiozyma suomiensis]|uniref:uncharacterized protein n=1 Tax=Kockiozyma suomiensis TaxID=1337062 RepID=UPI00334419C3